MIKISGLYKNFGDQSVLRGVDMEIQTGEAGVILGRSGSGKSVLLKHMAGLMQPDAGKVFIDDLDISSLNERELLKVRRQMAVMFQGAALFDSMNVGENIGFFLQREGKLSAAKIAKEVAGVLELVGLEGIQSKWPADLSGGMKKRVALARAIIHKPSIIFYDEPTAGLDPIAADSIDKLIKRICEIRQVTTVVITHDMRTTQTTGEKVFMLHDGKIYLSATPQELFNSTDPVIYNFVNGISDKKTALN
ncbi:MAG: ABC transporter ATP-binding protein [Limisphaerales bacterium]|mgnify:CR=1 FL=1|jgi:phospholipid/cholesterol/gamma-HCH transport system ATP-binding protein|nr:ATP-binding cassette domain-containing protein [Verrucomicrobiota bacterium]